MQRKFLVPISLAASFILSAGAEETQTVAEGGDTAADVPLTVALNTPERKSRILVEELLQKRIGRLTGTTATDFTTIVELLKYNRLGQPDQLEKLSVASGDLDTLEAKDMAEVALLLRAARMTASIEKSSTDLAKATQDQEQIVGRLRELLDRLRKRIEAVEAAELLQKMIKDQRELNKETRDLAAENLGKEELSPEEKQEASKLSNRQEAQKDQLEQVKEALEQMKSQKPRQNQESPEQQNSEEAEQAEKALEQMEKADLDRRIDEISKELEENKLASAFENQEEVLRELEKIQQEFLNQAENPLQELADSMEKLNELAKQQAALQQETQEAQQQEQTQSERREMQQKQDEQSTDD